MLKIFNLFVFSAVLLCGGEIEITSKQFRADELAGRSVFLGSVEAKRGADYLRGDKMIVLFSQNREVTRFEVTGNTSFFVRMDDNSSYIGEADEIVYLPAERLYTLKGKAWVEDRVNKRKVIGEHIVFNELTRVADVSGDEAKPVKLIFTIKDGNDSKP
ncbi:hypothetical protein FACS189487_02120 [Campylobacterota bacterium]|nr:hypothetical protein FACS189487_02120 [Campylobacterota bacterium]